MRLIPLPLFPERGNSVSFWLPETASDSRIHGMVVSLLRMKRIRGPRGITGISLKQIAYKFLVLASLLIVLGSEALSAETIKQISNLEAIKIANQNFQGVGLFGFKYGTYEIYSGRDNDFKNGIFNELIMMDLESLSAMGLIELKVIDSPSNFSGFKNFMKMPVEGYRGTVAVGPTEKGRKFTNKDSVFFIPSGTIRVKEIVKNESLRIHMDDYLLLVMTTVADWTPEYRELYAKSGQILGLENRYKALYKYDVFDKRWKYVVGDTASVGEDFTTTNVDKYIASTRRW